MAATGDRDLEDDPATAAERRRTLRAHIRRVLSILRTVRAPDGRNGAAGRR